MAKKSVVLTISIWDNQVRLALITKTMATLSSKVFNLNVEADLFGIRTIDPFEIVYFIRTGIQQLRALNDVLIDSIGVTIMPGYLMLWDHVKCTPVGRMYVPNNGLKSLALQEFKFSEFSSIYNSNKAATSLSTPNLSLNLWLLAKNNVKGFGDQLIISGIDSWLAYLFSGYDDQSLCTTPGMMQELLINDSTWDVGMLSTINLNEQMFPRLVGGIKLKTKNFFPLDDGVSIDYIESSNELLSKMLEQYSLDSVAFVQLSHINHIYFNRLQLSGGGQDAWVRFSGLSSLQTSLGLIESLSCPDLSLSHIQNELLVSMDPFQSFFDQTYHFLNMTNLNSETLARVGMLNTLFLIKYLVTNFEKKARSGHIKTMLFSSSDWPLSTLQLCVDICQLDGVQFKIAEWLDMIHINKYCLQNVFFSATEQQSIFKVKSKIIPSLDPLSCYSLYQPWEDWFNKLYDFRY